MATKKKIAKPAPKKAAPAKKAAPVKKATPAKKAAPAPQKAAPAKKAAPKKAAPAPKKAAPAPKKAAPAVVKKAVPAKKAAPAPKKATPAPVKKATPATKTAPVKKAAPVAQAKKSASPAQPAPAAKPAPKAAVARKEAPAKPVASKPTKTLPPKNVKDIKVAPAKPVSLPKIATKTSKPYNPEFMKSVLDKPSEDKGKSIVRYSDNELAEFRELISRKLEAAKKELNYLQGLITRKDEMGGDESENRYMTMEDGSLSMEREQLSQMASRQITFIDHLEKALVRIENKTYGICRETGQLIDKARLRAVPHATLSIAAKMSRSK